MPSARFGGRAASRMLVSSASSAARYFARKESALLHDTRVLWRGPPHRQSVRRQDGPLLHYHTFRVGRIVFV
jgi:hypothetical protein